MLGAVGLGVWGCPGVSGLGSGGMLGMLGVWGCAGCWKAPHRNCSWWGGDASSGEDGHGDKVVLVRRGGGRGRAGGGGAVVEILELDLSHATAVKTCHATCTTAICWVKPVRHPGPAGSQA